MAKIAIIGASYLQVPLVRIANEMGHSTICFAWEKGAVAKNLCSRFFPISIIDKEKILKVCKVENIDAILTIASDKAVPTISFVAEKLGLIGNSIHSSQVSTNKLLMREAFEKEGLNSPDFRGISKGDEIIEVNFDKFQYPLIVKPVDSSGSSGVSIVDNDSERDKKIKIARETSFCGDVIVEEYIKGKEISVEAISFAGKHHILAITDKVTSGPPHFVELEHHQPARLSSFIQAEIRNQTIQGLNALDIKNGASHSEFIIDEEDQVYITEIGARMGGDFIGSDLVKLSTGYDFVRAAIEVALGNFITPELVLQNYSGIYYYTEFSKWTKDFIKKAENYPFICEAQLFSESTTAIKKSADRSGFFIYQSKTDMRSSLKQLKK